MKLTKEIVIDLHKRLLETTGGTPGMIDASRIDASIASVYQTFSGKELYPTVEEKAARLCYTLNTSHPFVDGHKRLSMHVLARYLRFHDIPYKPTNNEVVETGLFLDGAK